MQKKQSEASLGSMMRSYGYFAHKWRDRGFVSCPSCHKAVTVCPYCHSSMLLPKAQTLPDFLVAPTFAYIECKQGEESWSIGDVSEVQEKVLEDNPKSWIFLEMGTGRAPHGKEAFLIRWEVFKTIREIMLQKDLHSVRFQASRTSRMPLANSLFSADQLYWVIHLGWQIPFTHEWWKVMKVNYE